MSIKKKLPKEDWQERIQLFVSGNTGRKVAVATEGMTIAENQVLRDVAYDPIGKGNDLIITLGFAEDLFTHTVLAPVELILHEEDNGVVSTLEIIDQNGDVSYLRLLN